MTSTRGPIDVLHVIESLAQGGAEQNLLSLLRQLDPRQFRSHLAWLYPCDSRRNLIEDFRPHVASLIPLEIRGTWDVPRGTLSLARWVRRNRPALIHTQLIRSQIVARVARGLSLGPPVVTTWVTPFYADHAIGDFAGSRVNRRITRTLDMATGLLDSHFVAVSKEVALHCAEQLHVPESKVTIIHPMLDPARFAAVPAAELAEKRRALGVPDDALLMLSMARLTPQKGHVHAINALPAILARHPNVVFLIAGPGPLEAELKAQVASHGLDRSVRFLGFRSDAPTLYQMSDLFFFPSLYEGLPVAMIEALANGLPAVLSDIPPHREVAASLPSVTLVPGKDVDGLSCAVNDMLDRGAGLDADVAYTTGWIRENFSRAHIANCFAQVFERAAAAH